MVSWKGDNLAKAFILPFLLLGGFLCVFSLCPLASAAEAPALQNAGFEEAMAQADRLLEAGHYSQAVERYSFASRLAEERMEFSRAYFGIALSYYHLKDMPNSEKWIRMVLEVDPNKEISVLFYPISFVQLFDRIRNEIGPAQPQPVKPAETPKSAPAKPSEKAKPEAKISPVEEKAAPEEEAAQPQTAPPVPPPGLPREIIPPVIRKGGNFEVSVHFSDWTLNPIKNIFESNLNDKVGEEIRRELTKELRQDYFNLVMAGYEQQLAFESEGSNYGLEMRYYTRGWGGSFSFGISFEKTAIQLALLGTVKQTYTTGAYAQADAAGYLTASLYSTNLSFRWELAPTLRVNPYLVIGFGVSPLKGEVEYEYKGTLYALGLTDSVEGSESKTFEEVAVENDFDLPDVIIVFQTMFGVKGEIYKGLTMMAEVGLWDGFLLRWGLAFRF